MPNCSEVIRALVCIARVYQFTLCEHEQLIEEGDNVAAGLVDGEHYGAIVILGEGNQARHDAQRIESVQAARRLIQEEDRWASNELASY